MTNTQDWLSLVSEPILEPDRVIVDPHHHLWHGRDAPYLLDDLWADTESGHRIEKTVFIECGAEYFTDGPEDLRPVGETVFVAEQAAQARKDPGKAQIAAIVGHANLKLGAGVREVLEAHVEAGKGLFRGIRHSAAWDASEAIRASHSRPGAHLYLDPKVREGFSTLAGMGLTFEAWLMHPQLPELIDLARAFPETTIVLNHFGGPIGIGPYEGQREEIFLQWKEHIATLAACPNVVAKLGGMAMPINGFGWHKRAKPLTSDEFVEVYKPYYLHTIDCFRTIRTMFESNFPVDKRSISYPVLWNGFKKLVADFSADEKDALFRGTASRVYRLT